ncbi:MAG: enoyl-CoA hydratase-related protein [Paracoccaceae bacterium]
MYETLNFKIDERGVGYLELNRPNKHNAISSIMINELTILCDIINRSKDLRVVILSGVGPSFCAGADLNWMKAQMDATATQRHTQARKLSEMLNKLNKLSKPVIGSLHGNVFGGGIGLACVCDLVIASKGTVFGFTETKLGLIPATIGPFVLRKMTGAKARTVFMSSRIFKVDEAKDLNIVNWINSDDSSDSLLEREINAYLNCAPEAVAEAKRLALDIGGVPSDSELDQAVSMLVKRWESEEAKKGIISFLNKKI